MKKITGVYAVTVPPSISDDPIRWLFADESDADAFAEACNGGPDSEFPEAIVTYEPIAYTLGDCDLRDAYPEEIAEANRIARLDVS